jgi:hypothetical protein
MTKTMIQKPVLPRFALSPGFSIVILPMSDNEIYFGFIVSTFSSGNWFIFKVRTMTWSYGTLLSVSGVRARQYSQFESPRF